MYTFAIHITEHGRRDVDGEDIVTGENGQDDLVPELRKTNASVKKPAPATRQTLTWNHLSYMRTRDRVIKEGFRNAREGSIIDFSQGSTTTLIELSYDVTVLERTRVVGQTLFVCHWMLEARWVSRLGVPRRGLYINGMRGGSDAEI